MSAKRLTAFSMRSELQSQYKPITNDVSIKLTSDYSGIKA